MVASRFIEASCEFLDLMDSSIWSSLGRRFVQEAVSSGSDDRVMIRGARFGSDGKSLDGVISHLTSKCGGNVHDVVTASSRGIHDSRRPKKAVDLQNGSPCFIWQDIANSWICLDFQNIEVTPTRSILFKQQHHPKFWCLEVPGEVEGSDRREPNNDVN
jgi:hypothetical protein